jgi:hypothetical protein
MKNKFILLACILMPFLINAQCPTGGSSTQVRLQSLDSLKNRTISDVSTPTDSPVISYQVADLLNVKDGDPNYPVNNALVSVTGTLILVKMGGAETCNCKSTNTDDWDFHLELAVNPGDANSQAMVCEITRNTKALVDMELADLKKLVGQKITVVGLFFYDKEHDNASEADSPQNAHDWRATTLEVHPVIQVIY